MDPHSTLAPDAALVSTAWYDGKLWKSCLAAFAVIRWLIVGVVFGAGIYLYQRDVNAQQTVNVSDLHREQIAIRKDFDAATLSRDKQLEKLLTREVYEAYRAADQQRMDRMEKMIEQLLERQSRQP